MNEKLINTKEAAVLLGISVAAVQKRISRGKLPVAEWRESDKGRGGRQAFLDPEEVRKSNLKPESISDNCPLVSISTNGQTNGQDLKEVKESRIKSNIRSLNGALWLSFDDVLGLYRNDDGNDKNTFQAQNEDVSYKSSSKNTLYEILGELIESDSGTSKKGLYEIKFKDKSGRLKDNQGKLYESQKKALSSEYRTLSNHIKKNKILSRKDPEDGRRTQILFNSLDEIYKERYRICTVRKQLLSVVEQCPYIYNEGSSANNKAKHTFSDKTVESHPQTTLKQQIVMAMDQIPEAGARAELVRVFCESTGKSKSTVYKWYKKALNPLTGRVDLGKLLRKQNKNRGVKKVIFSEKALRLFKSVVVMHGTFSMAHARREVFHHFGETVSSRQAADIVQSDPALQLVHESYCHGDKARWKGYLKIKQTRKGMKPLSLVTTDGHIFDVRVQSPAGDFRPVVVEIYDVATGMPLGWAIGRTENRELVSRALIQALLKYGHFDALHQDQGKAFFQTDDIKHQIREYLHLDIVSAPGYSPHMKAHQERNFGVLEDLLGKLLATKGYVGNSVANQQRRSASKGAKAVLTYPEFYDLVSVYFEKVAPNRKQGGLSGNSAAATWHEWEKKGFRVKRFFDTENKEDADKLYKALVISLGTRAIRTVKQGYITIIKEKVEYLFTGGFLSPYDGKQVEVCFNVDNPKMVFVFYRGKLIGEAVRRELEIVGQHSTWAKDEKKAYKLERKKQIKRVKNEIDKIDLFKSQMEGEFLNAVGFGPMSTTADISDLKLADAIDVVVAENDHGKVHDFTVASGTTENNRRSIFDVVFDEDQQGYETEDEEIEVNY